MSSFTESIVEEAALDVLRKLLNGEVAAPARKNLVESRSFSARSFSARLQEAILKYLNRVLNTAGWTASCTI